VFVRYPARQPSQLQTVVENGAIRVGTRQSRRSNDPGLRRDLVMAPPSHDRGDFNAQSVHKLPPCGVLQWGCESVASMINERHHARLADGCEVALGVWPGTTAGWRRQINTARYQPSDVWGRNLCGERTQRWHPKTGKSGENQRGGRERFGFPLGSQAAYQRYTCTFVFRVGMTRGRFSGIPRGGSM